MKPKALKILIIALGVAIFYGIIDWLRSIGRCKPKYPLIWGTLISVGCAMVAINHSTAFDWISAVGLLMFFAGLVVFVFSTFAARREWEENRAPTKDEWLYDVLCIWSDSEGIHHKAGARQEFQPLTLTMTHRPTNTTATKSSSFVPNKSDELADLKRKMYLELLEELQQEVLSRHEPAT